MSDSNERVQEGETRFMTLADMAEALDVSKSYVSRRARSGKEVRDVPVDRYARFRNGKILGFEVPPRLIDREIRIPPNTDEEVESRNSDPAFREENRDEDKSEDTKAAEITTSIDKMDADTSVTDDSERDRKYDNQQAHGSSALRAVGVLAGAVLLRGFLGGDGDQ